WSTAPRASVMKFLHATTPPEGNALLSDRYLLKGLFEPGGIHAVYWETDRTIIGGAVPTGNGLELSARGVVDTKTLCERREIGIINLGGSGRIEINGTTVAMAPRDGYYAGRGSPDMVMHSDSAAEPAKFYFLSYPAHREFESRKIAFAEVKGEKLGTPTGANMRTLYKYFAPGLVETCQLTMGFTELAEGHVWNTMPPHTHIRRSEVYCYFNVKADQAVFHFTGTPNATRHLIVRDLEAVLSPSGEIHSGVGTAAYSFVWGMGGENQEFADMQRAPVAELE
ncbi:MAG TPA: 5-dehydro-4-deoxy-D-glucuronate isomerase, partial [Opitutaceae bacterium]